MRKSVVPFLPLLPVLTALACLAAAPARAQSYTFTSDGTGTYFTDTLTMGRPHTVDFFSKTSGQFTGKASILTVTGYGNAGVVYTNVGQFYHENTDLTTASILVQDTTSGATIFSAFGPLHYEFITSPYRIDTLTLAGTAFDTGGTPWNLDFFKDEDGGTVTTHLTSLTPSSVPEPVPAVDLGLMLGLTLATVIWSARKRRGSIRDD